MSGPAADTRAFVTDRAVEGMIDKQELEDRLLTSLHRGGGGVDDHPSVTTSVQEVWSLAIFSTWTKHIAARAQRRHSVVVAEMGMSIPKVRAA